MAKKEAPADVRFHFLHPYPSLTRRTELKEFLRTLFKKEKKKLTTLNYIFCSDEYLLQINKDFLQHDYYTDIITFDLSEDSSGIIADIYISIERVKENAIQFSTPLQQELHRVIFHGALHLCGYKDKNKEQQALMQKMEQKYIDLYFAAAQ